MFYQGCITSWLFCRQSSPLRKNQGEYDYLISKHPPVKNHFFIASSMLVSVPLRCATGHGFMFHILEAYSAMLLSDENFPLHAMFITDFLFHSFLSET